MWRSPVAYHADGVMVAKNTIVLQYVVYIIYSESINRYYVGQTNDLSKRLKVHNSGGKKFTSRGIPWELKKYYNCNSRSEAVQLERKIKKRGIKRYLLEN